MLNTLGDIKNDILVKLNQSTTVAFYTDTILGDFINEAYSWATATHNWPSSEGRISTTYASLVTDEDGELRGEYPEGWKSESIRWMWIGGKRVTKTNFQAYKRFREESPNSQDKIFTDYGLLYYVNPNASLSGTVTLWGQYYPGELDKSVPSSATIFSGREEEVNEAIAEKALSFSYYREKQNDKSNYHATRALEIVERAWQKIQGEQSGYQSGETGMFEYINVTAGGRQDDLVHRDRWY